MNRALILSVLSVVFVLSICPNSHAVPFATAEYGTVPQREYSPAQETFVLSYYNLCSGWVWHWTGYCNSMFEENLPVQYGTCFDMGDIPEDCAHLMEIWWAVKCFAEYGLVDIEIYCARDDCCPVGPVCGGVYGYIPDPSTPWQVFQWGGACLGGCYPNFVLLITDHTAGIHSSPYSDHIPRNVEAGCQDWRCAGHSYVYKNAMSYCDWYGQPAPMWVSGAGYGCANVPGIPPGCHDYSYPVGVFTEFITECYIACLGACTGASATEDNSWSEIKAMYR